MINEATGERRERAEREELLVRLLNSANDLV
jgi:hypothetical protein